MSIIDSCPILFELLHKKYNVSRETYALLSRYVNELLKWQKTHNLIGHSTIQDVWNRHIVDSLQLISLINNHDKIWVDLGSGGGLPGLVIAIAQRDIESFHMHLIESQTRKAAFLQHCATLFDLPVTVYAKRIEVTLQKMTEINVLSARALTSLDALLEYASYCNRPPHKMLFLKGKGVDDELTQARKRWSFNHTIYPSHIDSSGCIVLIAGFDKL